MTKFSDTVKAFFGKKSGAKKNDWALIVSGVTSQEDRAEVVEKLIEIFPFSMEEAAQLVERTPIVLFENLFEELARQLERYFTSRGIAVIISNDPKLRDGCFQVDWPTPPRFDFLAESSQPSEIKPDQEVTPNPASGAVFGTDVASADHQKTQGSTIPFSQHPSADDFIADLYRELDKKAKQPQENEPEDDEMPASPNPGPSQQHPSGSEVYPLAENESGASEASDDELSALYQKLESEVEKLPGVQSPLPASENEPFAELPQEPEEVPQESLTETSQPVVPADEHIDTKNGEPQMPKVEEPKTKQEISPFGDDAQEPPVSLGHTKEEQDIDAVYKELQAALGEDLKDPAAPAKTSSGMGTEGIDEVINYVAASGAFSAEEPRVGETEMARKLELIKKENERLVKEIQNLKSQELALERADKEISERETRMERQGREIERLRLEMLSREEKAEVREQGFLTRIQELESQLDALKAEGSKVSEEKSKITQQALMLEKMVEEEKKRFEQMQQQVSQSMDERITGYEEDKKQLQALLDEKSKRVEELSSRVEMLESGQGELVDLKRQRLVLETELREMRESFELRLKETENVVEEKASSLAETSRALSNALEQKGVLEEKLNLVTSKVKQIVTMNRTLAQEKETLTADLQQLKAAYEEAASKREHDLQEATRRLQGLQRQMEAFQEEKEQLQDENTGLRDQVKLLTQERERLDLIQKRTEYQAKVRESEEQLKGIRQNRDIYLKEIEEKQRILDDLVSKQKDIESSLQEASQREKYILELLTKKDKGKRPGPSNESEPA